MAIEGLKSIIGVPKVHMEKETVSKSGKDREKRGKKKKKREQDKEEKRKNRIDIRA